MNVLLVHIRMLQDKHHELIDQQVLIVKVTHIIALILFAGIGTSNPEL